MTSYTQQSQLFKLAFTLICTIFMGTLAVLFLPTSNIAQAQEQINFSSKPTFPAISGTIVFVEPLNWVTYTMVATKQSQSDTLFVNISGTTPPEPGDTSIDALPALPSDSILSAKALRPEVTTAEYIDYIATHEIEVGDESRTAMALTFDCGGSLNDTLEILDILEANQAKATFFLEGNTVEDTPEIVPTILAGGHELGNHSYSHPWFTTISQTQVITELQHTEALIADAAGQPVPMRYFRFPYGDRDQALRDQIAQIGYQSVFWSIDPRGWSQSTTADMIIDTITAEAAPGGIILMHCNAAADREALPQVIEQLQGQGYEFDRLSEVVGVEPF